MTLAEKAARERAVRAVAEWGLFTYGTDNWRAAVVGYEDAWRAATERAAKVMREEIGEALGLDHQRRAFSWHDVQDAIERAEAAIIRRDET